MRLVFLGLSITSSWGNGHATTYRALLQALHARGHQLLFLERDVPWYADNRDLPRPRYCEVGLYGSLEELQRRFAPAIREADAVIVGSYVPEGALVGEWLLSTARGLTAFYDIDTPVTAERLAARDCEYLTREQAGRYDLYLSFTGGPLLEKISRAYGANGVPFYCSVDPALYHPEAAPVRWDLGYLGTYAADRHPALTQLLIEPARRFPEGRFMIAGALYPDEDWPANVERTVHLSPGEHRSFYNAQRFTLNVTRAAMVEAGWSPSVRLFEAAACGATLISDRWLGLDAFFAVEGSERELFVSGSSEETLSLLREVPERERRAVGERARRRVLGAHTADHRARELLRHLSIRNQGESSCPGSW